MTNILVTGANGQLGSEIKRLTSDYPFCFFFTDVDTLDLTDGEAVARYIADQSIDYVLNCAAYTAVDRAEDEEQTARLVNCKAVENLARAAGKTRIIHVSTDYVFSGEADKPLKETDLVNPQSAYGRTKLEGEQILQTLRPESIIIRTAWLYSSFGNNFAKTMIRLGQEKESLNVVSDQYGTPTYAADLAKAMLDIVLFAEKKTFPAGIYHYSNEGETTWYDFASAIMKRAGLSCRINPIPTSEYPTKANRPQYSVLDKTKIKETFQIAIPQWEASLEKCINEILCQN